MIRKIGLNIYKIDNFLINRGEKKYLTFKIPTRIKLYDNKKILTIIMKTY